MRLPPEPEEKITAAVEPAPSIAIEPAAPVAVTRREQPQSLTDLFVSFSLLALQGFGGVLAVAQRVLVEQKRWYTRDEFVDDWAVAQILPGPNVINLGIMIGDRYFGMAGAAAALAGMLAAPMVVVLVVAALFAGVADVPAAQGALRGMGAVAAGLITATGLKLVSAMRTNVMGLVVCWGFAAATFAAVALVRVPLAWVLLCLGSLSCLWAYRQLGRVRKPGVSE
ncbi:MAG: chromate transporter [Burkholderiaceae bacterium]|nr:chromate transporter [Burkholderiaceae bacterium]